MVNNDSYFDYINTYTYDRLSEYLTFDLNELMIAKTQVKIFGGSLRDILSNGKINDIDLVAGPRTAKMIISILEENGFTHTESVRIDVVAMYKDIHCISEPSNYIKIVDGSIRTVQVMKPVYPDMNKNGLSNAQNIDRYISDIISNVDISCCGLSYDTSFELTEWVPDALLHAVNKMFTVNEEAKMHNINRIDKRIQKHIDKGFKIMGKEDFAKIELIKNRRNKIKKILNKKQAIYQ